MKLDEFTRAYLDALVFTDCGPDDPTPFNEDSLSQEMVNQAIEECAAFQKQFAADIAEYGASQAGHDFWMTRNGHGVGFWEYDHATPEICDRLDAGARAAGRREIYDNDGLLYFF